MAGEAVQALHVTNKPATDEGKSNSRAESDTAATSSSMTMAAIKIANKIVPDMTDYWKESMITEGDHQAYHDFSWLTGNLMSSISNVHVPMVDGSSVVCFESHLITGLGLSPSKFLVAVMSFLWCELVHLYPNAITALSCLTMLCECWLGIASDTSLFWYFYFLARYNKFVYSGIGLSHCRHRCREYIDATFKSS
jgi:hypothetical protein